MRIQLYFTLLSLFNSTPFFAQSSRTITYHHFYQIRQIQNKHAYSFDVYGALYIQNDTLSIYKLTKEEKDQTKKFDLSSIEANHSFLRSLTTMKGYRVDNSNDEHIFIEITKDTSKWEILSDRDTIMNICSSFELSTR